MRAVERPAVTFETIQSAQTKAKSPASVF